MFDKCDNRQDFLWQVEREYIRRDGFTAFCNAYGYKLARHHLEIANRLQLAATEGNTNLIICMPPGHAKSTYTSHLFPPYYLGVNPGHQIISASHTASFAAHWGKKSRDITLEPQYKAYFNAILRKDSRRTDEYELTNKSRYYSCGIGAALAGRRFNFGLIDDPLRNMADSFSEVKKDWIWNWYLGDFRKRALPGASQVVMMTRYIEDDLVGRILNSSDAPYWEILSLPALAKENDPLGRKINEPLWPEMYDLNALLREKAMSETIFNAQYQQSPTKEEGTYFLSKHISVVDDYPSGLNFYGATDYAVTEDGGDYTVHVVVGHQPVSDMLFILDIWRERETANISVNHFIDLAIEYETKMWADEKGFIFSSLNPFIEKEIIRRRCFGVDRVQFFSGTKKHVRALAFQSYFNQDKVKILNAEWTDELIKEMLKFPKGKYDDQVDALGLIGRMVDEMVVKKTKIPSRHKQEYRSNTIILPGLNDRINKKRFQNCGKN